MLPWTSLPRSLASRRNLTISCPPRPDEQRARWPPPLGRCYGASVWKHQRGGTNTPPPLPRHQSFVLQSTPTSAQHDGVSTQLSVSKTDESVKGARDATTAGKERVEEERPAESPVSAMKGKSERVSRVTRRSRMPMKQATVRMAKVWTPSGKTFRRLALRRGPSASLPEEKTFRRLALTRVWRTSVPEGKTSRRFALPRISLASVRKGKIRKRLALSHPSRASVPKGGTFRHLSLSRPSLASVPGPDVSRVDAHLSSLPRHLLSALRGHARMRAMRRVEMSMRRRVPRRYVAFVTIRSRNQTSSLYSSLWNKKFASLNRFYTRVPSPENSSASGILRAVPEILVWVQSVRDSLDRGIDRIETSQLPQQSNKGELFIWMQVSLFLLRWEPDRMIDFLRATHFEPYVPINWVEDSMNHLARYYDITEEASQPVAMQRVAELFCTLANRGGTESLQLKSSFLRLIMRWCTPEQIDALYQTVVDHNIELHGYTYLHFATDFAKRGHFEKSLETLLKAANNGVLINQGERFRQGCSTLLRSCMLQPEGLRLCLRVVSNLVDIGVQLNGPICDIIMLNAVDAGDVNTAFSVYQSLVDRGLEPRESTFAILLKGCKVKIDDVDMLNGVIRDAIGKVNVRASVLLGTEIMHCLALHHTKHNPDTALSTLTEAYAQLFDLRPLERLGLPLPPVRQGRAATEQVMTPSPHVLGFMISASIQHLHDHPQHPDDISRLYVRWRHLVEHGDPELSQLATTSHVSNIFLMAFIKTPSGLITAARIVRDMQRALPSTAIVEQCAPGVHTWSIFLHGFTRHKKTQLGEQVLTYMRKKGVEPNHVTWSTLLLGYANMQNVEGAFDALRRAEESGDVWNDWTAHAVNKLRNRSKVNRAMAKRSELREFGAPAVDFTEDLKAGLGEKLREDGDRVNAPTPYSPLQARLIEKVRRNRGEEADQSSKMLDGFDGRQEDESEQQSRYKPMAGFGDSPGEIAEQSDDR